MHSCPMVLLLIAASGCSTTTSGISPSRDPGPPDGRWQIVATRSTESATIDPGVVACKEEDRHSFEHATPGGWSDQCGWRRHTTCTTSYNYFLGSQRSCEETTPDELIHANLDLHVRRLFAAGESCHEDSATLELLERTLTERRQLVRESTWRVTGCGKRARILCRGGAHPSGYHCERMEFRKESAAEAIAETLASHRARWGQHTCAEASVIGERAEPITLADGRPGLTVALAACDQTFLYTCLRPDLVAPDQLACQTAPLDPAFTASALEQARVRVEKEHRCQLPATALTLVGERSEATHRSAVFRVTSCNPTRDVRTVRCRSVSLVDGAIERCTIDPVEAETRASLARAGDLASVDSPPCGPQVRRATLLSATGDRHLVHVLCFGTDRPPLFYECRRDVLDAASDGATCQRADAIHDAAATLEQGARERFQREEHCPADKTKTSPVEPRGPTSGWRARASGCGVTRDYVCKDLTVPIARCTLDK